MPTTPCLTICVLLYGDHPSLAQRCLNSLMVSPPPDGMADFRLGLNTISLETRQVVTEWTRAWTGRPPVIWYEPQYGPQQKPLKYPLMRRMFHDPQHPLGTAVMWFDDDSYLVGTTPAWWQLVREKLAHYDMLGQLWYWKVQPGQREWFNQSTWCQQGTPYVHRWQFCQGAWWCLHRRWITQLDWPPLELRHFGGDSLLGEILRHRQASLGKFDTCVRINADERGKHSGAPRRGTLQPAEKAIARDWTGGPLPTDHHDFEVQVTLH